MDFKIEKQVPLPKYGKSKLGNVIKYPIDKLSVGDSFVTEEEYNKKGTNRVRARIMIMKNKQKMADRNFSVAGDPFSNKIRVWRTG